MKDLLIELEEDTSYSVIELYDELGLNAFFTGTLVRAVSSSVAYMSREGEKSARYGLPVVAATGVATTYKAMYVVLGQGLGCFVAKNEVVGFLMKRYVSTGTMDGYWDGTILYRDISGAERAIYSSGQFSSFLIDVHNVAEPAIYQRDK